MTNFNLIRRSAFLVLTFFYCSVYGQGVPPGYYDSANGLTGDQLKAALHNIIDDHITFPYSSSGTDTWDILKEADRDPNNSNNVIGIYSGFSMDAAAEYNNGNGWNREHVWAKSRGDFGTSEGAGTDAHHLRAEDITTNSARGNLNFDFADYFYNDTGGNYSGPTLSKASSSDPVWEPRDAVKGDVARMIFYMAVRYEGTNGEPDLELTDVYQSSTSKSPLHAKVSTLVQWHLSDPVDAAEMNRNDVVYSYQQNRNPFIDHPAYVCEIYGSYCSPAGNNSPYFTTTPVTSGTENQLYTYTVTAGDADGDPLSITAPIKPTWLNFTDHGDGTATLSGTPSSVGSYAISLSVGDGIASTNQSFDISISESGGGSTTELFISEYIEGSSYNKGLEIANYTDSQVDLSQYSIKKQSNGSGSWGSELQLSNSLPNNTVYVLVNANASSSMQSVADVSTTSGALSFNGNDAIGLFKNGVLIDMVGTFNSSAYFGQNTTLIRAASITSPSTTYSSSDWNQHPEDYFNGLGSHIVDGGPSGMNCSATESSTYSFGFETGLGSWSDINGDFNWTRNSGSTPSSNTGPSAAYDGSFYLYTESSTPNYSNKTAIIESPCFDLSGESTAYFSFRYHMYGASNMGDLKLKASIDGITWTDIWTKFGNQGNNWLEASVDLSAYIGTTVKLRFVSTTGSTWQGDVAIDDISFSTGQPNNNTIKLTLVFDNYPEETSWEIREGDSVIASGGTYGSQPNGATVVENIDLSNGCYDFIIYDAYGDGICCAYGSGSYTLEDGSTVLASGGSFGSSETTNFCLGTSGARTAYENTPGLNHTSTDFKIYPNPVSNKLTIESRESDKMSYAIIDSAGKNRKKGKLTEGSVDVSTLPSGFYLIKLMDGDRTITQRIIIE